MDIDQIRAARQKMEAEILAAVNSAMGQFYDETGMSPDQIDVSLIDVTRLAERERHYVVSKVRCTIPL